MDLKRLPVNAGSTNVSTSAKHRVLISAENNAYMAWQCQLLHYSCVTKLNQVPLIVVHGSDDKPLSPGYSAITRTGGLVRRAPSYRLTAFGADYPPRNTPASLLHAAEMNYFDDDFFVLCDPDMIFVYQPDFATMMAADWYSRELNFAHRDVQVAARRYGVQPEALLLPKLQCGVPHVVPVAEARSLALAWIEAIDTFKSRLWEISMYAFGMAVCKLGIDFQKTQLSFLNDRSRDPLPTDAAVIHYCCGDRVWTKDVTGLMNTLMEYGTHHRRLRTAQSSVKSFRKSKPPKISTSLHRFGKLSAIREGEKF